MPEEIIALAARLRAAGCVYAEDEARLLLDTRTSPDELEAMVRRRVDGEPLEVILGWAEFCGLRINVAPGVFVPRQRSEFLVVTAVELVRPGSVVVDLCCGSGALGVAVATKAADIELYAADIDPVAVACARRNVAAVRHGQVCQGDLFDALPRHLRGRADLLIVNAPYVPTGEIDRMPPEARDHEPHIALDGGPDGVDVHRRVAAQAPDWLAPGGHVLVETSAAQAELTATAIAAAGLTARVVTSAARYATAVIGARPERRPGG